MEDSQPQEKAALDDHSLECLVYEHYSYVRRLALSILDDPHEADDAAQEAFIAASRAWAGFRGEASPRTWLTAITVNACRSRLRKRRVRQGLQSALQALHLLQSHPQSLEQLTIQRDASLDLRQALAQLGEKHRLVVVLRYVHGLSVAEIAAALDLPPGTVHSRLFHARRMLLSRLEAQNPHLEAPDES